MPMSMSARTPLQTAVTHAIYRRTTFYEVEMKDIAYVFIIPPWLIYSLVSSGGVYHRQRGAHQGEQAI